MSLEDFDIVEADISGEHPILHILRHLRKYGGIANYSVDIIKAMVLNEFKIDFNVEPFRDFVSKAQSICAEEQKCNFVGVNKYDFIDLLDVNDGLYCPAIILDVVLNSSDEIDHYYVKYVGWADSFNVNIPYADARSLIFPRGTFIREYKCWVNYGKLYPMWPSKVFVRDAKDKSKDGIAFLKAESRILVMPYGDLKGILKQRKSGDWIASSLLEPLECNYDKWIKVGKNTPTGKKNCEDISEFLSALEEMDQDLSAEVYEFKFVGTYEVNRANMDKAQMRKEAKVTKALSSCVNINIPLEGIEKLNALKAQRRALRKRNAGKDKLFEVIPPNGTGLQSLFAKPVPGDIMANYSHMNDWSMNQLLEYENQLAVSIVNPPPRPANMDGISLTDTSKANTIQITSPPSTKNKTSKRASTAEAKEISPTELKRLCIPQLLSYPMMLVYDKIQGK